MRAKTKGTWMVAAVALAVAVGVGLAAIAEDAAAILVKSRELTTAEKYDESNQVLMDLLKAQPDNPDVYWRIAENYYNLGERIDIQKDKAKKLEMYKQCEQWAKKGLDKNPGLADNSFWMAVGISQQVQVNGIAKSLLADRTIAKKMEDYYLAAARAKEFHYKDTNADTVSSANFALGQFYRKVPSFPGVSLLLSTSGDIDKSVEYTKKAYDMYPKDLEYVKEAGVSLMCRFTKKNDPKDLEAAKKYLNECIASTPISAVDKIDQADCKKLLADPKLACGYSRVQQEEVSADAFKDKK
jgi:tetratricopeptide (TPR) repeat protein